MRFHRVASVVAMATDEVNLDRVLERLAALELRNAELEEEQLRRRVRPSRRGQERGSDSESDSPRYRSPASRPAAAGPARNSVDTRHLSKPEPFSGSEGDWAQFALLTRAYVGAVQPRMFELMKFAE